MLQIRTIREPIQIWVPEKYFKKNIDIWLISIPYQKTEGPFRLEYQITDQILYLIYWVSRKSLVYFNFKGKFQVSLWAKYRTGTNKRPLLLSLYTYAYILPVFVLFSFMQCLLRNGLSSTLWWWLPHSGIAGLCGFLRLLFCFLFLVWSWTSKFGFPYTKEEKMFSILIYQCFHFYKLGRWYNLTIKAVSFSETVVK